MTPRPDLSKVTATAQKIKLLGWAGDVFRWFVGAVVPMFVRPVPPVALAWFVHVVLVIAATVGLFFLQKEMNWTAKIGKGPDLLKPYWVPALFLLVYFLMWAASWLWQALTPNQPITDFPDLDEAWAEAVAALDKAGIGIADTPLFLVLGTPAGGYDPLFRALPHGLVVAGGTSAGSPLRVYANRDGIYLALPGATLLGAQEQGGLPMGDAGDGGGSVHQSLGIDQSVGIGQSVGIDAGGSIGASVGGGGGSLQEIQRIIRQAREENRPLSDSEKERVRVLSGGGGGGGGGGAAPEPSRGGGGGPSVLQNTRLVANAADRLLHVCGLIAAARWPLCPVNGAILTVPMSAAEKDEPAQQWGLVARQDLEVAEAGLKLGFPVYALVTGVEELPGGHLFFDRFAADKGNQRLGKGFPLNPDVRPTDVPAAVESAVGWVFGSLLPYWALKLTRVDSSGGGADTKENAQLVRFLAEAARRGPHLARLVSRAVVVHGDQVPVFAGCYLSVIAQADPNEAKFAKEFWRKVETTQGYVAWTDEAFAEDASYRSMAKFGYVALAVVLLALVAFAAYVAYDYSTKVGK